MILKSISELEPIGIIRIHIKLQVHRGFAGFFIVSEDEEEAQNLPSGQFYSPSSHAYSRSAI